MKNYKMKNTSYVFSLKKVICIFHFSLFIKNGYGKILVHNNNGILAIFHL
jgi:hypothetical protein